MKKLKALIIFLILILIPITLFSTLDNYFSERTEEYLEHAVTFAASDIFSTASLKVADYQTTKSFLKYSYGENNQITGVYVDTIIVNLILAEVSDVISTALNNGVIDKNLGAVPIPLGQFISKSLFASAGPEITIKTSPMHSYTTDLYTEAIDYGINNTLFEVYILAVINIEAFIPLKSQNICLETKIYLISEVLQGSIPVYYSSTG